MLKLVLDQPYHPEPVLVGAAGEPDGLDVVEEDDDDDDVEEDEEVVEEEEVVVVELDDPQEAPAWTLNWVESRWIVSAS